MRKRGIQGVNIDIQVPFFDVDMMHVVASPDCLLQAVAKLAIAKSA